MSTGYILVSAIFIHWHLLMVFSVIVIA